MSKRRQRGEGSVYTRKEDGQVVGSISVRRHGGGRTRRVVYGKTKAEVQEMILRLRADSMNGLPIVTERISVREFAERWLGTLEGSGIRPTTLTRYSGCIRLHVLPAFGDLRLSQLGAADLQSLYATKRRTLSSTTVHHIHRITHTMLEQALRWGCVVRNVAHLVKAPKIERSEMRVWTKAQARAFIAFTDGDRNAALYILALATGMRQGEVLGLRWSAVDLDNARVSVQKTLYRGEGGRYQLLEPKTASSRRSIEIDPAVTQALREHRKAQLEDRLRAGSAWANEWDLVFASPFGQPLDGTYVTNRFHRASEQASLPRIRFHDLRHTCATILLQDGVHPKVVQEMLGHSTIAITLDTYSHVIAGMHQEASRAMGKALFG